jgi:hypothetical protein
MAAPTSAAAPDTGTLALAAKATAATPTADAAITDPSTGLEAQTFDVDPIANTEHTPPVAAAGSGRARTACRSRTCGRSSRRCTSR